MHVVRFWPRWDLVRNVYASLAFQFMLLQRGINSTVVCVYVNVLPKDYIEAIFSLCKLGILNMCCGYQLPHQQFL